MIINALLKHKNHRIIHSPKPTRGPSARTDLTLYLHYNSQRYRFLIPFWHNAAFWLSFLLFKNVFLNFLTLLVFFLSASLSLGARLLLSGALRVFCAKQKHFRHSRSFSHPFDLLPNPYRNRKRRFWWLALGAGETELPFHIVHGVYVVRWNLTYDIALNPIPRACH